MARSPGLEDLQTSSIFLSVFVADAQGATTLAKREMYIFLHKSYQSRSSGWGQVESQASKSSQGPCDLQAE